MRSLKLSLAAVISVLVRAILGPGRGDRRFEVTPMADAALFSLHSVPRSASHPRIPDTQNPTSCMQECRSPKSSRVQSVLVDYYAVFA